MSNSIIPNPNQTWFLKPGALQSLVEQFTDHLASCGHTALTVRGYGDSARHFSAWLDRSGAGIGDIDSNSCQRFANHRCRCPGGRRDTRMSVRYTRRVLRFVGFLSDQGVVRGISGPEPAVLEPQVVRFLEWLRNHRGITEPTISRHGRMVTRLLRELGSDPATYDAASIRRTMLAELQLKNTSPAYAKTMTTALRGYLRFLGASGVCPAELMHAVPTVPAWRLSSLPRYLAAVDVERMIESCDLQKAHGIRDKAVLLLLTRLGLRAGDILHLRLGHIDWTDGTLRVSGKGRREVCLPLPQDAGEAMLDYIRDARPVSDSDIVFLRSSAPYQPFAGSSTVSSLVRLALGRAGITNPPSRGANLLRHSAATSILCAGATLDAIGAVLRHRSPTTTAHYAKVDVPMLLQVAHCWPGEASC
jgi:integrase/recombinase XerD